MCQRYRIASVLPQNRPGRRTCHHVQSLAPVVPDRCYPRQKISGCTYPAVAEYNIARRHMEFSHVRAQRVTKSKLHMAADMQICKTCNGADELAIRTLLCDELRTKSNTTLQSFI